MSPASKNSFAAKSSLNSGNGSFEIYRLSALEKLESATLRACHFR